MDNSNNEQATDDNPGGEQYGVLKDLMVQIKDMFSGSASPVDSSLKSMASIGVETDAWLNGEHARPQGVDNSVETGAELEGSFMIEYRPPESLSTGIGHSNDDNVTMDMTMDTTMGTTMGTTMDTPPPPPSSPSSLPVSTVVGAETDKKGIDHHPRKYLTSLNLGGEKPAYRLESAGISPVARSESTTRQSSLTKANKRGHIRFDNFVCLLDAALEGDLNEVRQLIEAKNVHPDTCNSDGVTSLHCAVGSIQNDVVKYLIQDAGANVNVADDHGWTPLHSAAYTNNLFVTRELLMAGADVEALDSQNQTPSQLTTDSDVAQELAITVKAKYTKKFVRAIYDFSIADVKAAHGDELGFRRGAFLRIVNRNDRDWWYAELARSTDSTHSNDSDHWQLPKLPEEEQPCKEVPSHDQESPDDNNIGHSGKQCGYVPRQFVQ